MGSRLKIGFPVNETFRENEAKFREKKFREFFAFSKSRKFRIYSRNRLKQNFAKKTKIFAFFANERNAKTKGNGR